MSRSRRKTPIFGITTAKSEAFDKACWHRAFRRSENQRLQAAPHRMSRDIREFYNPWLMHKDGKQWCSRNERSDRLMRK